jgi:hypothetical protein
MKHRFFRNKLTIHLDPVQRLQIRGVKPPLLCIPHGMALNKAEE